MSSWTAFASTSSTPTTTSTSRATAWRRSTATILDSGRIAAGESGQQPPAGSRIGNPPESRNEFDSGGWHSTHHQSRRQFPSHQSSGCHASWERWSTSTVAAAGTGTDSSPDRARQMPPGSAGRAHGGGHLRAGALATSRSAAKSIIMPQGPAARLTDFVAHPLPPVLMPWPEAACTCLIGLG